MPINQKKMKALKEEYGEKHGEEVYYALEQKQKNKDKQHKSSYSGYSR